MTRTARYENLAVASSSPGKYDKTAEIWRFLGLDVSRLSWLKIENGLAEPVERNPKDVGIKKMQMFQPNIDEALEQLDIVPDHVAIMDVLAVVKNLPGLTEEQAVMKKPENMSALESFTSFFALCKDKMEEGDDVGNPIEILEIAYYLINAVAPVDQVKKKLDIKKKNSIEVGYDRVDFFLNKALVDLLADPDSIRQLALEGFAIGDMLTNSSIVGFRIQELIPTVVDIAAKKKADGVALIARGDKDRGGWDVSVDGACDLVQEINVGVKKSDGGANIMMPFIEHIKWAVKNVTPWLVERMYIEKRKTNIERKPVALEDSMLEVEL